MARLNIKPAASGMSHHSYDVSTIASLDFGELLPVRCIETVKKDHFTQVQANGIIRLSPQVFPAYGKCFVKSAAFYVPEYQIFEASDAFHTNMSTWKGQSVKLPFFYSHQINNLFSQIQFSTMAYEVKNDNVSATTVPAFGTYDFVHLTNHDSALWFEYRKLTRYGEHCYKILKSLGYEFASYSAVSGAALSVVSQTGQIEYNALPLLAYLKVYCDFFLNPQFYNDSPLVALLNAVQFGKDYSYMGNVLFNSSTGEVSQNGLNLFFAQTLLPHQGGMYLDAWNSPNSPDGSSPYTSMISSVSDGIISPYISSSSENVADVPTALSDITALRAHNSATLKYLSAVGLRILTQFDKFVRRRGLSGNKSVERIYSMFGIKSNFFDSHYCHKIFDSASRIDFNPVLSNSNTWSTIPGQTGSSLGSYAGYASSGLNFNFEHKCDSFGYIICVTWLQVVPMLMHGVAPTVLRKYPFDFYTPEYDGQTVRAIPHCEVSYAKSGIVSESAGSSKKIYGYTNLYDDYRFMKDSIVGDFVTSVNAQNFLFGRDISVFYQSINSNPKPQSTGIHYYDNWSSGRDIDMTDPFQIGQDNGDRFYLQLDFHIEADRPIKSESDAINLNGEGELQFSMNGNSMS